MALVRWSFGDEEEREKEQQQLSAPRVIQSVQQGAWQPTQVSSDGTQVAQAQKPENYLMSEQKAQVDEGIRQRRAAEEQARAQAAAEAQARAQAAAQMQAQAQSQPQQVQKKQAHPGKDHNGWKKYYGEEFNKAQKGLGTGFQGFVNRMIDGGQASKQAEIHARNRYNNELLAKAYDNSGNTLNQAAANKSREVAGYNMERAMQSAQEVRARVNSMGANSKRLDQGFWNQMGRQVNAIKGMSLYDGAFGVNDTQKASFDDAGRFVGNLAQGIVTMPLVGAKEAAEAARGRGTDAQTGLERELNGVERLGRGVSGALNIALPFMTGGGVKFMDDLFGVVAKGTATQAQKATLAQILRMSGSGALTQGGLGAAQATGEWVGNGGSLLDEKGNLNEDKIKEFVEQVGVATAMSAAGGAVFAGGGGALRNIRRGREPVPVPREPMSQPEGTPVRPDPVPVTAPVADGNVNFTPVRPNTPETPNLLVRPDEPAVDGIVQPTNDVTPVTDGTVAPREAELPEMRPVTPEQATPEPETPQAADGAVAPRPLPEGEANMPVIRSEEVRQLQEARAGTTQAEEAAINQRLQQIEDNTPAYMRRTPKTVGAADYQYARTGESLVPEDTFDADLRARDSTDGDLADTDLDTTPAYMRKRADERVPELESTLKEQDSILAALQSDKTSTTRFNDEQMIARAENVARRRFNERKAQLEPIKGLFSKEQYSAILGNERKEAYDIVERVKSRITDRNATTAASSEKNLKYNLIRRNQTANELRAYQTAKQQQAKIEADRQASNTIDYTDENIPAFARKRAKAAGVPQAASVPQAVVPVRKSIPEVRADEASTTDTPRASGNLPDDMAAPTKKVDPEKQARQDVADVIFRNTSATQGLKGQLARALDKAKDTESTVSVLLEDAGLSGKRVDNITSLFKRADEIGVKNAKIQKAASKDFVDKGFSGIDQDAAKVRNARTREEQEIAAELLSEIERLGVKGKKRDRLVKAFENVTQGRSANMLLGAPLERNWIADMLGTVREGVKNPAQIARGATQHGNIIGNTLESQTRDLRRMPKSFTEGYKQLTGGTFQALMTPAQVAANVRVNAARTQLAARIYKAKTGENLSLADAETLSRNIGNDINALANMAAGVDNGTVNDLLYRRALKQFDKFLESGNEADWTQYLDTISRQNSLSESIMRGIENKQLGKTVSTAVNFLLPFMRNATNMTTKAFTRDMNPFSLSILDELRSTQMGGLRKLGAWAVNNGVNFGILYGLSSLLTYNDGSEVDKPRGVSIDLNSDGKLPDGVPQYLSVRATPIELPLALTLMTKSIVEDTMKGEAKKPDYYFGMIGNSIPYVDQMMQNSGAVGSLVDALNQNEEGDDGYAAKAFGVNMATSLTPFANNNLQAWMDRNTGKSTDAKSTYDKDPFKWYWNKLQDRGLGIIGDRDSLKGSYDAAGRQRTVDNQGAFVNKTINDERTATYNDTIDDLVEFGRDEGLGKGTQDMFNTYVGDKNHRFEGILNKVTFLDAPEVDGESKPDNATKLQKNEKLAEFNQQIYNGFFGDGGDELLKLNGEELRSEVTMPNKNNPDKSSGKPISIGSIRNAIAQTDLPGDQWDKLNAISEEKSALAARAAAKEISWSDYYAALPSYTEQENAILSNSKGAQKLGTLMNKLKDSGFFEEDGLGSTRSGQAYLWNSLNALLGQKGKTPAAEWKKDESGNGFTPWGRRGGRGGSGGSGFNAIYKPGEYGAEGIKWTPAKARQMANVARAKYTPVDIRVKLGNEVKRNRTQNYADRSF